MNPIEEYEQRKRILQNNKEQYELLLENAQLKYNRALEELKRINDNENVDPKQKRRAEAQVEIAARNVIKRKSVLDTCIENIYFLRPSNIEDMKYRDRQYKDFPNQIKENLPDDLHLCFHGCPINTAKHIIEDGEISSSVDRLGTETSYDESDQISVTTKNTIETTVQGYSGLTGGEYPAGCIFVITPKDESEIASSESSMIIENVDFKKEPDRLYSIITTPENIERVSEWAKQAGIDISKIHDYDDFIQMFSKDKRTDLLPDAIENTKEATRTGEINDQVDNIKQIQQKNVDRNQQIH